MSYYTERSDHQVKKYQVRDLQTSITTIAQWEGMILGGDGCDSIMNSWTPFPHIHCTCMLARIIFNREVSLIDYMLLGSMH